MRKKMSVRGAGQAANEADVAENRARRSSIVLLAVVTVLCAGAGPSARAAAPDAFNNLPQAAKDGAGAKISFSLTGKNDVEVAVLDAKGAVVRHLAAGVLGGEKAPPPPLKEGLAQELAWDGNDDFGKPAQGGPFKVRVRAGLGVVFGRTLAHSPYEIETLRGLASDAAGNLYVLHQVSNSGPSTVQVYSDTGEYRRTAFPFAANLPRERLGDLIYWDEANQRQIPRNYNDIYPRFLPYSVKAAESVALVPTVTDAGGILIHTQQWLFRLDVDGSTGGRALRYGFLFATGLSPYDAASGAIFTAASPDGTTLYACGPASKLENGEPFNAHWPAGQVFSMPLDDQQYMKPFAKIDVPAGWEKTARTPLAGIACDEKKNVYVCDRANGRIAALDAGGKAIGEIKVADPYRVAVHPKTGAIYVLSMRDAGGRKYGYKLARFEGLGVAKASAELDLGVTGNAAAHLALTAKDGRTGVWLAGVTQGNGRLERSDVTRYEEQDGTFAATVKFHEKNPDALGLFDTIAVDPFTDEVYINDDYSGMYRYNGLTGEGGNLRKLRGDFYATEVAVGRDGFIYARTGPGYSGPLERLTRELKPAPLPSGTHLFTDYIYSRYGAGHAEKGVAVGPRGEVYVMNMYGWQRYAVYGLTPEGKFMDAPYLKGKLGAYKDAKGNKPDSAVIGPVPDTCGGLRVDSKGNIYVGMLMLPPGYEGPAVLKDDPSWRSLVGSILKFPPEGGEWICTDPRLARAAPKEIKTEIPPDAKGIKMENGHFLAGATFVYPSFAPFSGTAGTSETGRPPLGRENCACRSPRFDIDPYDRLYVPNAVTCEVRILDNAGNLILRFGDYGNDDSAGPESAVPQPAIPLGWPVGVGTSAKHIYISDQVNRRVLRVDKTYAREETADVD